MKTIDVKLKVIDTMIIIEALNYMLKDDDRSEIDKEHAQKLKQKFANEWSQKGIEIGD